MIRKLNESYSDINSENVWDAYAIAEELLGSKELSTALAKAMGNAKLSTLLGYIFQDYDIPFGDDYEDDYYDEYYESLSNRRRPINEETNWSQVDQTTKQKVRKILEDNGYTRLREFETTQESKGDDGDTIRYIWNIWIDQTSAHSYGADPLDDENEMYWVMRVLTRKIKNAIGPRYTVLPFIHNADWSIQIAKV